MSDQPRENPAKDTLKELERLQEASRDALACYLALQKRIAELQGKLIQRPQKPEDPN